MKRYIKSHGYLSYNVNPRGTNTGDCQTRAIALAFDISWDDARKLLRKVGKDWYNKAFLVRSTLVDELGCTKVDINLDDHSEGTDYLSVAEFCDTVGKSGTYLVVCTPNIASDSGSHLVCTINGTIYDTWDSSRCKVTEVYKPSGEHRTEGIEVTSDIPKEIWSIALDYERCFNDKIADYDVDAKIKELIPELSDTDVYNISKQMTVYAELGDNTVHSFNFVIDLKPNVRIWEPIQYKLSRKKPCNISFTNSDTAEDALTNMESKVSALVDAWFVGVINNIKERLDVSDDFGNLRDLHLTSAQVDAYKSVSPDLRKKIVHLETFCGYISASVNVAPDNLPLYYILVISKSPKYLNECVTLCCKYDYEFWNDYHTSKICVLPHGFTYRLQKYYDTYRGDKNDFKEFLESYEDYLWNVEHNEGHDIDYYFREWEVPQILT